MQDACNKTNNAAEKLVCSTSLLTAMKVTLRLSTLDNTQAWTPSMSSSHLVSQGCHTISGVGKILTWHEPAGGHKRRQVPCSLFHSRDQDLDDLLWLNQSGDGMQPHVHHHHTFSGVVRLRTCRHYPTLR